MTKTVAIVALAILLILELWFTYIPVATLAIIISIFSPQVNQALREFVQALGELNPLK